MNYLRLKALAVVLLHIAVLPGAQAAINFYVEDYSTDRIVITLSGTFEADTAGDQPGWLAIKRDWSNNIGTDTTWFLAPPGTVPTLEAGSQILVDGELCSGLTPENLASANYNDTIYCTHPDGIGVAFSAGESITGSITLSGAGLFDPSHLSTLEFVSGYDTSVNDWHRLEATARPAPRNVAVLPLPLMVFGLLSLLGLGLSYQRGRRQG